MTRPTRFIATAISIVFATVSVQSATAARMDDPTPVMTGIRVLTPQITGLDPAFFGLSLGLVFEGPSIEVARRVKCRRCK